MSRSQKRLAIEVIDESLHEFFDSMGKYYIGKTESPEQKQLKERLDITDHEESTRRKLANVGMEILLGINEYEDPVE